MEGKVKEMTLRDIQLSSLLILKELDDICVNNNLDYFVMYGTLIGAARHKGFIPWDDDIDIMMPRDDYNKLIKLFSDNDRFKMFCKEDVDYPYMISRLSDVRYELDVDNEKNYGIGLFVDIYPLDDISDFYFLSLVKGRIFGWLSSLYFLSSRLKAPNNLHGMKGLLKKCGFIVSKLIGTNNIRKILSVKNSDKISKKYVGCREWMTNDYKRNIFKYDLLKGRVRIPFEDIEVNAPANYDTILSNYYGEYMTLPPEKDRVPHHFYKAYKRHLDV